MSNRREKSSVAQKWSLFDEQLREAVPHLSGWWSDSESFREIRIKARPDETYLAIAKGFGSDGGPVVSFGVGYDVVTALIAVDRAIQGGSWRFDKPWDGKKK